MGAFMLFVLWTVGLIVISVQLWGPAGSVNANCQLYVGSVSQTGVSVETLAWLEQRSICMSTYFLRYCCLLSNIGILTHLSLGQSWTAAWAFQLVGDVFLLWMMIMAYQVYRDI